MGGEVLATCEARAMEPGVIPDWVHLMPGGMIRGRDGRTFYLDNIDSVIRLSMNGADLPVDYDHDVDQPRAAGPRPAAGWIKELAARKDGLWGRVDWTPRARQLIADREYRYLSPAIHIDAKTKRVMSVLGAGLVHRPNLNLTALNGQEDQIMNDTENSEMGSIRAALGLHAQASTADIIAAIRSQTTPDPAEYVPVAAVADLLKDRNRTISTNSMRDAEDKVDRAVLDGYITPAMREWAIALCSQDASSFDAFMESAAPAYAHLSKLQIEDRRSPRSPARHHGGDEASICAQLGLSPGDLL